MWWLRSCETVCWRWHETRRTNESVMPVEFAVQETRRMTFELLSGVELSPAGLGGLGPLHLPQASGFAGGR